MTQPGNSQDKYRWHSAFNTRVATVGSQVGCLTLMIVLGAVFGGIWLDNVLGTKPLFILLLVLGSAPLSLVLTYWLAMRQVKDFTPPPTGKRTPEEKEEETGE